MKLEQYLTSLNAELGTSFQVEEDSCILVFDDMEVSILDFPNHDIILLSGTVGELPPYSPENLYAALLMANHHFQGTKGATFSLNPETKEIVLAKQLATQQLSYEDFHTELENFVNTFESWRGIIHDYIGGESQEPSDQDSNLQDISITDGYIRV